MSHAPDIDVETSYPTSLEGTKLVVARVLWVFYLITGAALFFAALPGFISNLNNLAAQGNFIVPNVNFTIAQNLIMALILFLLGVFIFFNRNRDWLGILASVIFIWYAASLNTPWLLDPRQATLIERISIIANSITLIAWFVFFMLIPDGRPVSLLLALFVTSLYVLTTISTIFGQYAIWIRVACWILVFVGQIYRYRTTTDETLRHQLQWAFLAMFTLLVVQLLGIFRGNIIEVLNQLQTDKSRIEAIAFSDQIVGVFSNVLFVVVLFQVAISLVVPTIWELDGLFEHLPISVVSLIAAIVIFVGTAVILNAVLRTISSEDQMLIAVLSGVGLGVLLFQPIRNGLTNLFVSAE